MNDDNKLVAYQKICYVFWCVSFNVKFKRHHLVAVSLQLAFDHIVPAPGHLKLTRISLMERLLQILSVQD